MRWDPWPTGFVGIFHHQSLHLHFPLIQSTSSSSSSSTDLQLHTSRVIYILNNSWFCSDGLRHRHGRSLPGYRFAGWLISDEITILLRRCLANKLLGEGSAVNPAVPETPPRVILTCFCDSGPSRTTASSTAAAPLCCLQCRLDGAKAQSFTARCVSIFQGKMRTKHGKYVTEKYCVFVLCIISYAGYTKAQRWVLL